MKALHGSGHDGSFDGALALQRRAEAGSRCLAGPARCMTQVRVLPAGRQSFVAANVHPMRPGHSHSIIDGLCKPLIRLTTASNRVGFTVRCTATSSVIPSRSFHDRSTSIENRRRFHYGLLSRSIDIYRVPGPSMIASTRVHLGQGHAQEGPASNAIGHCPDSLFSLFFYRQVHQSRRVRMCRLRDDLHDGLRFGNPIAH